MREGESEASLKGKGKGVVVPVMVIQSIASFHMICGLHYGDKRSD